MKLQESLLENWLRKYYFICKYDLGSSGVRNFSFKELQYLTKLSLSDFKNLVFDDSKTFGNDKLRTIIADRFGDGNPNTVLIGNGSNEVIYIIMNTLLLKNDEVIVLKPIYYTLSNIALALKCKLKYWELDSSNDFYPDLNKLEELITSKTRMVIVNFPHNPTGVTLTRDQFDYLVKLVSKVGAYLVWDAAFEDLVYNNLPLPNPYLQYEKTIYINTLTKSYGLAGLRLGWCIASPKVLENCYLLKDYLSLYVSPLNELIGAYVINNLNSLLNKRLSEVKGNLVLFKQWLNKNSNFIYCNLPEGGVSAFIKLIQYDDTEEFCRKLINNSKVLLIPGKCFGHLQYIRLGFGSSESDLKIGLDIIQDTLIKDIRI